MPAQAGIHYLHNHLNELNSEKIPEIVSNNYISIAWPDLVYVQGHYHLVANS